MMSGMPLETCWAFKKLLNNKFYYKAASCWYFYWVIYDARIHEYQMFYNTFIVSLGWRPVLTYVTWWMNKDTTATTTASGQRVGPISKGQAVEEQ
jgi:hypothetical protein